MLEFRDVSFGYTKKKAVLDSVSFSLQEGAVTALLGINGAGKSTITWLSGNLLTPDEGDVFLFGEPIKRWTNEMKKGIGLLSSTDPLFEFFTIDEHLEYVGRLYRIDHVSLNKRIANLKSIFDLDDFNGVQISTLSTGNRRKMGIITTLIHSPRLLIWDEPFNGLDPIATVRLKELIVKLKKSGVTIFMTSQVIEPVEAVCDRIMLLNGRKLLYEERVENLSQLMQKYKVNNLESLIYQIGIQGKSVAPIDWL